MAGGSGALDITDMKTDESKQIQKETLNGFKQYLLNQSRNQSMSEEFTNGLNYAIWEMERFALRSGIDKVIEGSVPYKVSDIFKKK